ncbi:MAG: hypothetical protein RIE77_02650 [Phycisphaerales bacterium]|jgi:hypothetical protein
MPTKPVILSLLVAIAIVVASMWLLRPPSASATAEPQPVLDVDAASIVSFETRAEGENARRIERSLAGWQLIDQDGPPWAVQDGRARAAARILADLKGRPVGDEDLPPVASTLTITDARGRTMSLGLREPVVGGRRVVDRVDAEGGVQQFAIDEPLYEAFVLTGLAAWRDEGLLGALPGRPARLELARGDSRLELARVDGRWSLRAPVSSRASEQGVDALLQAIARLRVERFDEPPPPAVQAATQVTITVEADRIEPMGDDSEPVRTTERLTLTLHGPADTGGRLTLVGVARERRYRSAGAATEFLGATFVAIDLEPLQQVTLEARGYVAATAIEGDATLVTRLELNDRVYARTDGGWAEGDEVLPADRAAALDAFSTLLTTTAMTGVELTDAPQPAGRASRPVKIEASAIGGEALTPPGGLTLRIVEAPGGASGVLLIGDGVTREYTDAASTAIGRAVLVLSEPVAPAG